MFLDFVQLKEAKIFDRNQQLTSDPLSPKKFFFKFCCTGKVFNLVIDSARIYLAFGSMFQI